MHRVCIRLYVRKMYTRSVITTAGLSRPVLESWTPNPFNKSGMTHQCYGRGREVWRLTRRTKNDALDRWMSRRLGSRPSAEWLGPCARDQFPSSPSRAWILSGWGAGRRFGSAFDRGMHRGTAGSSLPLDGRSIFCSFAGGSGAAPWAWRAASATGQRAGGRLGSGFGRAVNRGRISSALGPHASGDVSIFDGSSWAGSSKGSGRPAWARLPSPSPSLSMMLNVPRSASGGSAAGSTSPPSPSSRTWILSGWGAGRRFGSAFDRGMHKGTAGSSLPLDGRSIFCSFAGGSGAAPWAWRAASAPRSGVGSVASDSWAGSGHTMHATVPRGTSCRLECPQVPCSPHSSVFRPQGKVLHGPGPQVLKSHGSWAFPRVSWFLGRLLA